MRIAITGGTGFVGRHLARLLAAKGHEVVLIARGIDRRDRSALDLANTCFFPSDLSSVHELARAFSGCAGWRIAPGSIERLGNRLTSGFMYKGRGTWWKLRESRE